MIGTPDGKPLAPAAEIGAAAAQPATAQLSMPQHRPRLLIWLPGEMDITNYGLVPGTLILDGDIDEETYPALMEALSSIPRDNPRLHVDLAAVTFCDLAGLRAIVRLAGPATQVILHEVPKTLRIVMKILGWDQEPGLVISGGQQDAPGRGASGPASPPTRRPHLP